MKNSGKHRLLPAVIICLALTVSACVTTTANVKAADKPKNSDQQDDFAVAQKLLSEGKTDEAEKKFAELLAVSQKQDNPGGVAANLSGLAFIDMQRGKLDDGIKKLEKAMTMAEKTGNPVQISSIYNSLGAAYVEKDKRKKAVVYYRKALELDEISGNHLGKATTLNNIGKLLSLEGETKQAMRYYTESMRIFIALGDKARADVVLYNMRLLLK